MSTSHLNSIESKTAASKWAKARTMAGKVGKGLCKDDKAHALALRHWLEAKEREAYEVIVKEGRLIDKKSQKLVHSVEGSEWIFVLSSSRILYVGEKKKGQFQHSSFVAGGATIASGILVVQNGVLDKYVIEDNVPPSKPREEKQSDKVNMGTSQLKESKRKWHCFI
ncbi:hypothetical protein VNO77_06489 [Canavalia gladiata]|uniref:Uncharacterized protein n=1 Tax=Canavalia gladiata TaxID=3824 RepID=A0AAN9M7F4_CANGL